MISVEEALARVLALAHPVRTETVGLKDAAGRVLAQDAIAALTQPPFDSSAMDGYALRSADIDGPLTIIGEAGAGHPWHGDPGPGTAIRIFTGAPVPEGYNRVTMQEHVQRDGDILTIIERSDGTHIRPKGGDFIQGDRMRAGRRLTAADIGLLAAMNVPHVAVACRPRVAILAGGDELVSPGTTPAPGQIISSNDLTIAVLVKDAGGVAQILPFARDTEDSLHTSFEAAKGADLLVTIGGASVGDHDLIGKVAGDLGLDRSFYKIAMRPGKPLIAGRLGETAMLGLPGNPVSAVVCGLLFMQPLIRAMQGQTFRSDIGRARLAAPVGAEGPRQHYLRAEILDGPDLPVIRPYDDQDSARLSLLSQADALLIRPAGDPAREAGEIVSYLPLPH